MSFRLIMGYRQGVGSQAKAIQKGDLRRSPARQRGKGVQHHPDEGEPGALPERAAESADRGVQAVLHGTAGAGALEQDVQAQGTQDLIHPGSPPVGGPGPGQREQAAQPCDPADLDQDRA
ncbi:hypothetical protein [Nonomuraea diastatica]|uniref:hypothetical protein n=1 Tax=Nonomuraea diastatica TaxID=1848329 RepID=UPI001407869D|nr:hypothetical protein [Nonomuraea diastatica]